MSWADLGVLVQKYGVMGAALAGCFWFLYEQHKSLMFVVAQMIKQSGEQLAKNNSMLDATLESTRALKETLRDIRDEIRRK